MTERDGGGRPLPGKGPRKALRGVETEELVLAELVSRVLDRGVVVGGEVTISVAGIDLVHLALRLHLSAVETIRAREEREAREASGMGPPDPAAGP